MSPDAAEGLYRLVDAAYERRSVAVSSNLHPAGFDELMPKTLATATVDRLMHHAHVCVTSGDSERLAQATAGQGVVEPSASPGRWARCQESRKGTAVGKRVARSRCRAALRSLTNHSSRARKAPAGAARCEWRSARSLAGG